MKKVIDVLESMFNLDDKIAIYNYEDTNCSDCDNGFLYEGTFSETPIGIIINKYVYQICYSRSDKKHIIYIVNNKGD